MTTKPLLLALSALAVALMLAHSERQGDAMTLTMPQQPLAPRQLERWLNTNPL